MIDQNRKDTTLETHKTLEVQYCPACEKYIFYPRELCPYCLEVEPAWKEASGRGELYSYTVVRRSALEAFEKKVPYIYALVDLDEGVRVPTRIVDCPIDQVKIGMAVEVAWQIEGEKTIPVFRPAA